MRVLLALALVAVLLAPTVGAKPFLLRNDDQSAEGDFVIPRLGDEGWEKDLFVVTGRMEVVGETDGPFLYLNATDGVVEDARRVEVYRVRGAQSYRDFVPQVFDNATVTFGNGSDVAWLPPTSDVDGEARFATAVFLDVLGGNQDLRRARASSITPSGLIASVHGGTFSTQALDDDEDGFLVPLSTGSSFTVHGERSAEDPFAPSTPPPAGGENETTHVFAGKDFVVRFLGPVTSTVRTPLVHLPFTVGAEARFAPAAEGDFEEGFDLGSFQKLLGDVQTLAAGQERNDTSLDSPEFQQLEKGIDDLAPLLNGVLIGSPRGEISVRGEDHEKSGLTVLRFTALTFTNDPPSDNVQWTGSSRVAYTDGGLQTSAEMVHVGPLFVPALGIVLWLVAIGLIVFAKSRNPPVNEAKSAQAKIPAIVTWLVLLVVSFVLWDREVKYLLGTSLLSGGAGSGASAGAVAFVELLPWSIAYFAFGLPIVLGAKSGLKFGGLDKRAKGFAKGAGALATWFLGSPYILPIVGEFVRTLVNFFK